MIPQKVKTDQETRGPKQICLQGHRAVLTDDVVELLHMRLDQCVASRNFLHFFFVLASFQVFALGLKLANFRLQTLDLSLQVLDVLCI